MIAEIIAEYNAARTEGQAYRATLLLRSHNVHIVGTVTGKRGDTVAFMPGPDHWHGDKKLLVVFPPGTKAGEAYWITIEWRGSVGFAIVHGSPKRTWQTPAPRMRWYVERELRNDNKMH